MVCSSLVELPEGLRRMTPRLRLGLEKCPAKAAWLACALGDGGPGVWC